MKNKKISFVLFTSIFVSAICIAVYVYTIFFFNIKVKENVSDTFEYNVELVSQNLDKNIKAYSTAFDNALNSQEAKNFIIEIFNSGFMTREDSSYISQILNKNKIAYSDIAFYKDDGWVLYSSKKDTIPLDRKLLPHVSHHLDLQRDLCMTA